MIIPVCKISMPVCYVAATDLYHVAAVAAAAAVHPLPCSSVTAPAGPSPPRSADRVTGRSACGDRTRGARSDRSIYRRPDTAEGLIHTFTEGNYMYQQHALTHSIATR